MKKFNNKKGFTIVELVIVIAVIGILAGVLIPTFSGIVQRANESKINQEMTNALKVVLAGNATSGALANGTTFVMGEKEGDTYKAKYYAEYNGNKFETIFNVSNRDDATKDLTYNNKIATYDKIIVGTDKNNNNKIYEGTLKAIESVTGLTVTGETVSSTTQLTVLTNSDLSEGMFVLVPKDGAVSTTTVTVTVNGTAVKADATAELSDDKKTVTIDAAVDVASIDNVETASLTDYTITYENGKLKIVKVGGGAFTTSTEITINKKS